MNITSIMSIIIFLLILTIIVFVHELGHFLTAKKFGVYCKEFAIGMGPKIFGRKKGETLYSVRALPMGGYVQMIGEDGELFELKKADRVWLTHNEAGQIETIAFVQPDDNTAIFVTIENIEKALDPIQITYTYDDKTMTDFCESLVYCYDEKNEEQWIVANNRQFTNIKPWKKVIVLAAGATMNFIFAFIFIFFSTWITGVNTDPIIATDVYAETVGENAFIKGDEIIAINNETITSLEQLSTFVQSNPNKTVEVEVLRNNEKQTVTREITAVAEQQLTLNGFEEKTRGALGVTYIRTHTAIWTIFTDAVTRFGGMFQYIFFVLYGLFTAKIKVSNLTGFIGIAQQTNAVITATTASTSFGAQAAEISARLLSFAAFLSVNIGAMNLLPFPALDGGRIVFALYEMISKKKASPKIETYVNAAGFILLILLFFAVTIMDVIRLFS